MLLFFSLFVCCLISHINSECSVREPEGLVPGSHRVRDGGDGGFYLEISGSPGHYQPGGLYTVSLRGDKTSEDQKLFSRFQLVVENAPRDRDQDSEQHEHEPGSTGSYQLLGDVLTRFSDHCTNTVTEASDVAKDEVQVLWTAPPAGSGCVVFKATVVDKDGPWAMDAGRLSTKLCELVVEEHSEPDEVNDPCCACEEAKYEVTFEGLWSNETHPKDFPKSKWLLHFSDIIGASHSADYRVWHYDGFASKGLAQVAKWGSARVLESELKAESAHIRTIIKARGLWYPNVNGKTFAVFRTDSKNHLVSLVTMLGPSPDWIVGVSGLELCLKNCSWAASRELFLYPWDAGVDSGLTYESPDEPTVPQQPITRITSTHPNDPRQPFHDPSGLPMKPLAKLTIARQRLYKKSSCYPNGVDAEYEDFAGANAEEAFHVQDESEHDEDYPVGCEATTWSSWSSCSVTCGKGLSMRTRSYSRPDSAKMSGCDRQMVQKEMCSAAVPQCEESRFYLEAPSDFLPDDMCATSEWSRWSECSTTCGKGFLSRTRRFYNRMGRKKCPHVDTMEKSLCAGSTPTCPGSGDDSSDGGMSPLGSDGASGDDGACAVTSWSEWSPCSVSCGKGLRVRTRLYRRPESVSSSSVVEVCRSPRQLMEKSTCAGSLREECRFDRGDAQVICGLKKEVGPCRGYFPRWYYDPSMKMCLQFIYGGCRGNSNNFERRDDCSRLCEDLGVEVVPSNHTDFETAMMEKKKLMMSKKKMMDHDNLDETPLNDKPDDEDDEDMSSSSSDTSVMDYSDFSSEDAIKLAMLRKQKRMMMRRLTAKKEFMLMKSHMMVAEEREKAKMEKKKEDMMGEVIDCLVTAWSPWSDCDATCGRAFRRKFRMVKRFPSEGGKACPKKMERRQKCRLPPCASDCVVGPWGAWSACSQSCGQDGVQSRAREVEEAREGSGHCGNVAREERRVCLLQPCHE